MRIDNEVGQCKFLLASGMIAVNVGLGHGHMIDGVVTMPIVAHVYSCRTLFSTPSAHEFVYEFESNAWTYSFSWQRNVMA